MALTVSTYYFDAHNGITDSGGAWANDANAFDGNTGTSATSTGITYLQGDGTTYTAVADSVVMVRVRTYSTGTPNQLFNILDGAISLLAAPSVAPAAPGLYYVVTPPAGGWTTSKLQGLSVQVRCVSSATGTLAKVEMEVTHGTVYDYPIMVGENANYTATGAARYFALANTNDTALGTTSTSFDGVAPVPTYFSNFKLNLGVAPGAGVTRFIQVSYNDGANINLAATIADPATSGSDTTDQISLTTGDTVNIRTIATGGTPAASSPNNWRVLQTGENQIFLSPSINSASASATRWLGVQDSGGLQTTSANQARQIAPASATLKNLIVQPTTPIAAGSYNITVYTGTIGSESASAVTVTLNTTTAGAAVQDTTHSIAVTQGQGMYIQIDPVGTPTVTTMQIGLENVTGDGTYWLLGGNNSNTSATVTQHNNWYGTGAWQTAEADTQALGYATTLIGLYAVVGSDPAAGKSRVLTFRINGADTAGAVTFNNTGAAKSWSGSVSIATDDLINVRDVPTGSPTAANLKYGLVLQATQVPNPPSSVNSGFLMFM